MVISVSLEPTGWMNESDDLHSACAQKQNNHPDFFLKEVLWFFLAALGVSRTLGIFAVACGIFAVAHGHFSCGKRAPESRCFSTCGMQA